MKKAICLVVLFTVCAACQLELPATTCNGDGECPQGYYCSLQSSVCVRENWGTDGASRRDHFVTVADASTDAVSADGSTGTDSSQSDVADAGRADATSADAFAPDTTASDTATPDTATADAIAEDATSTDAVITDAGTSDSADAAGPECVERDTTCASLYGADHYCWQGRCVLANASYCGPFRFMALLDTNCTEVIWRIYGYTGPNPVREILHGEPGRFYDSIPGVECSAEAECAAPNMGGCRTVFDQLPLVLRLCPWDLGHP